MYALSLLLSNTKRFCDNQKRKGLRESPWNTILRLLSFKNIKYGYLVKVSYTSLVKDISLKVLTYFDSALNKRIIRQINVFISVQ